jgi:glycerophosphoryl diester phosphodiesterase
MIIPHDLRSADTGREATSISPLKRFCWLIPCLALAGCVVSAPGGDAADDTTQMRPLVVGHRGASGYRPEHTIAAYTLAIEQGVDYIEPDLVITSDGVLVARHENEIGGTTDVASRSEFAGRRTTRVIDGEAVTGWFTEDFTLAEIKTLRARERLPRVRAANTAYDGQFEVATLDEIIALVADLNTKRRSSALAAGSPASREIGLYIELKHSTYFELRGLPLEEPLIASLERAGLNSARSPVIIQSFETGNLRKLRRMSRVRLAQLLSDGGAPYDLVHAGDPRTYADLAAPAGLAEIATYAHAVGAAKNLVIPRLADNRLGRPTGFVRDAHAAGLKVHVWTFRAENTFLPLDLRKGETAAAPGSLDSELNSYLATGIDGVFSDHPDVAVAAVRAMKAPKAGSAPP